MPTKKKPRTPANEQVAERLRVAILEAPPERFEMPFPKAPQNPLSGARYSGSNYITLMVATWLAGYSSAQFATFNQIRNAGGCVKKGAKGWKCVRWSPYERKAREGEVGDENGKVRSGYLKTFVVFNVSQTEGLELPQVAPVDANLAGAAAFVAAAGADFKERGGVACYVPSEDRIYMPGRGDFPDLGRYYTTAFHELAHWTGADHRLGRNLSDHSKVAYAKEELVAEGAAALLADEYGLDYVTQHAAYLRSWLLHLTEEPTALMEAFKLAGQAVDYLKTCVDHAGAEAA